MKESKINKVSTLSLENLLTTIMLRLTTECTVLCEDVLLMVLRLCGSTGYAIRY